MTMPPPLLLVLLAASVKTFIMMTILFVDKENFLAMKR
ncbi:hypothetical protein RV00_GL001377 [Enterococcus devriesei]|uniref:Uncharacterized protein n=1 Tax=Enterococcus devriesei TaxID=319970 RepID=A0A1L8SYD5_9ENTE|nr:hypothetical protein RV00_GL001377 [Enterococcus devriesei]